MNESITENMTNYGNKNSSFQKLNAHKHTHILMMIFFWNRQPLISGKAKSFRQSNKLKQQHQTVTLKLLLEIRERARERERKKTSNQQSREKSL